jgi:uncharacterized membrane protein
MVIILKIFLSILSVAFGYITFFVVKEYSKFRKSQQSEGASLIEKFMIGAVAFSCVSLLVLLFLFCILMICSSISITLPF